MSNASKQRRKLIVDDLRREGREAYAAGKNRGQCPHKYMDEFQWLRGFDAAENAHWAGLTGAEKLDELMWRFGVAS